MRTVPDSIPKASHPGVLRLGDVDIDVYVLPGGVRAMSTRGAVGALAGADTGDFRSYLAPAVRVAENHPAIARFHRDSKGLSPAQIKFYVGDNSTVVHGIDVDAFADICDLLVAALATGKLRTQRQREVAIRAALFNAAAARVGYRGLVDEATGYQRERAEDDLRVKLAAMVAAHLRPWTKVFPDELWVEFARLTRWSGDLHERPKWWGHLVNRVIYEALDADVAKHIRETKPPSTSGHRLHQWLTEDFGAVMLRQHIGAIVAIARTCTTWREFVNRVEIAYRPGPAQFALPMRHTAASP